MNNSAFQQVSVSRLPRKMHGEENRVVEEPEGRKVASLAGGQGRGGK